MNRRLSLLGLAVCCALLITALAPTAQADPWNKKTYFTFPSRVEVPGGVILEPGKYVFKLADSMSNRHIVQIFNERENHVYATILAIANQRMNPAEKSILTFYEMPGDQPEPVKAWFYPGDTIGQEFAYPKQRALEISQAMHITVPVATETTVAETRTEETLSAAAETPAVEENPEAESQEAIAQQFPAQAAQASPRVEDADQSDSANRDEPTLLAQATPPPATPAAPADPAMPSTASYAPLLGLVGAGSLLAAAGLRRVARRR